MTDQLVSQAKFSHACTFLKNAFGEFYALGVPQTANDQQPP